MLSTRVLAHVIFTRKVEVSVLRSTTFRNISGNYIFNLPKSNSSYFIHTDMKSKIIENLNRLKGDPNEAFKFTNYDCIGFDLDNTLARYKVGAMIDLEYSIMSNFLVNRKGYSKEYLLQPLDHSFIIKGLIVDDLNGNLLRIDSDGGILQASHGTKILTEDEIIEYYPNRHWEVTDAFSRDPIATWNGPYSEKMRTLLDYYDICVSAIFARAVDSIDHLKGKQKIYYIWPDILECLIYMFNRDHFETGTGEYFEALKEYPDKYYYKCSNRLLDWLKSLKATGKSLFLITGSHVDFASHTAHNTIGPEWRSLFDIVVCFAKKPGFFTMRRDFIQLQGTKEVGPISPEKLEKGGIYTHGNWTDICEFLKSNSSKPDPTFLYIGDNLVQDIYTPNVYTHCDTVTVCEELEAEGLHGHQQWHPDEQFLVSTIWGSYFHCKHTQKMTNWYYMMKLHSKICIPSLEYVATLPLEHEYEVNHFEC